jgi:hypothetical protein
LFVTVPLQAPWRHSSSAAQQPEQIGDTLVFFLGTRELRAKGPTALIPRDSAQRPSLAAAVVAAAAAPAAPVPTPEPTAPLPVEKPARDTGSTLAAYDPNAAVAPSPQVGDGRLWVSPRPGLPASVAAAIYGDTTGRNQAAIARLKAMVDSLNQILDQIQRENKRPSWVVGGTPDKPTWGIDSANIHVAGIKIPTVALALLNLLPKWDQVAQGNYDEGLRARQLQYMREDLMQAAARAQSFQQFRSYVRELRARKQAERDADDRRHDQDTVRVVP